MPTNPDRHLRTATAVIEQHGRYLITQRHLPGSLPGPWEFPGGKVAPGDADETTIERVVRDRLGVDVKVGRMKAHKTQHYAGYSVDLVLYETTIPPDQAPRPLRVADLRWVTPGELEQYPFPPADQLSTDLILGVTK